MKRRELRRAVARRAGGEPGYWQDIRCAYCGVPLLIVWEEGEEPRFMGWDPATFGPSETPAHLDHVIPECLNGPTTLDNTVIACRDCNQAKGGRAFGDAAFQEYLADERFMWPERCRVPRHEVAA